MEHERAEPVAPVATDEPHVPVARTPNTGQSASEVGEDGLPRGRRRRGPWVRFGVHGAAGLRRAAVIGARRDEQTKENDRRTRTDPHRGRSCARIGPRTTRTLPSPFDVVWQTLAKSRVPACASGARSIASAAGILKKTRWYAPCFTKGDTQSGRTHEGPSSVGLRPIAVGARRFRETRER